MNEMGTRVTSGVFWVTVSQASRVILLFVTQAVIAHFVGAREFGLLQAATIFVWVATLFVELGTGPAIVQKQEIDRPFLSTVFLVNVTTGIAAGGLLWVTAPFIAGFMKMAPELTGVLRWITLSFILGSLGIVQRALLQREMRFKRLSIVEVIALTCAGVLGITLAVRGHGVYALVWQLNVYQGLNMLGLWAVGVWKPAASLDFPELKRMLKFSLSVSGASIINQLGNQLEKFLIGRFLGAAALGYYGIAVDLITWPLKQILSIVSKVLFPALSAMKQDLERVRKAYLRTIRYVTAVCFPIVSAMALTAPELVCLIYGPGWERSVLLVQVLSIMALRIVTAHSVGAVFLSQGRADRQLKWTLVRIPLLAAYIFGGMYWGIEGVAVALATAGTVSWIITHSMANKCIELKFGPFIKAVLPSLGLITLVFSFAFGLRLLLTHLGVTGPLLMVILLAVNFGLYALLLKIAGRRDLAELIRMVREHGKKSGAAEKDEPTETDAD